MQNGLQVLTGVRTLDQCDLFRCAGCDNLTALVATFRTEIDDPVGRFDDVQIMLDDSDGVTVIAQAVQYAEQLLDIMKM